MTIQRCSCSLCQRFFKFLPGEQLQAFLPEVTEKAS